MKFVKLADKHIRADAIKGVHIKLTKQNNFIFIVTSDEIIFDIFETREMANKRFAEINKFIEEID